MGDQRERNRIKSRVDELPDEIRAQLDAMLADVNYTYQDIADTITDLGYEISRSAVEASKLSKKKLSDRERAETIARLEKEMKEASRMLEFEYAALLRDQIIELRGEK